ncbi:hypothetical protein WJX73_004835 [Symbiochloris irregularis]|uniref:Uncharacterized protein n=1 Tax=Symbiochloris irregularis TaxID=706552 RepID=A0AAW1NP71_9CHLO
MGFFCNTADNVGSRSSIEGLVRSLAEQELNATTDAEQRQRLTKREESLRTEKDLLRREKLLLLEAAGAAPSSSDDAYQQNVRAGLCDLWKQLSSLELQPAPVTPLPEMVLVRAAYVKLADMILAGSTTKQRLAMLITGMSGTGKTVFLFYLAWRLARLDKAVLLQRRSNAYYFMSRFLPEESAPEQVVYLADALDPTTEWSDACDTILTSPANRAIYQNFIKDGAVTRIMPPWTLAELRAARPWAHGNPSPAELDRRFNRWGGSARWCLSASDEEADEQLDAAISRFDLTRVVKLIGDVGTAPESNQILTHIPNERMDLQHYELCSAYVAQQVVAELKQGAEAILLKLLEDLRTIKSGAGVRGNLFEVWLLNFFLLAGGEVTVARYESVPRYTPLRISDCHARPADALQEGQQVSKTACVIPRTRVERYTGSDAALQARFQALTIGGSRLQNVCFQPDINHPALDAMLLPNIAMQIHFGAEHDDLKGTALDLSFKAIGVDPSTEEAILQQPALRQLNSSSPRPPTGPVNTIARLKGPGMMGCKPGHRPMLFR